MQNRGRGIAHASTSLFGNPSGDIEPDAECTVRQKSSASRTLAKTPQPFANLASGALPVTRALPLLIFAAALSACGGPSTEPPTPAPPSAAQAAAAPASVPAPTPAPAATKPSGIEGLLAADDTLATAQARLGASNVREQTLNGAEGETLTGWVVYPDDPTRTADVFLDEANAHPAMLRIGAPESVWARADGIRIGLSSAELQALNGKAFEFYGFEWDYGGAVTDFHGGRLDPGDAPRGSVTLCPPRDPGEDYPSGDATFTSDDPRMVAKPATVCEFTVPIGR